MDKDCTAFILSRQMHCLPQIQLCCRSASSAWSVPILPGGPLPSLPSCKPTETVDTCQAVPCSWLVIHLRVRAKRNRISFPAGLVCKLVFIVALQLLLVAAVFLSHLPDAGLCRELRTLPQGRGRRSVSLCKAVLPGMPQGFWGLTVFTGGWKGSTTMHLQPWGCILVT